MLELENVNMCKCSRFNLHEIEFVFSKPFLSVPGIKIHTLFKGLDDKKCKSNNSENKLKESFQICPIAL